MSFASLTAEGLPVICIDARHAKAALDMAANETDANDADGLAHLAEVGFYREVRVKGFDSMLSRTLVAARTRLIRIKTELSNQIRGMMKTFGLIVPAGKGSKLEANVRALLAGYSELKAIAFNAASKPLLDKAGVEPDAGIIDLSQHDAPAFIELAKTRQWDREPNVRLLA